MCGVGGSAMSLLARVASWLEAEENTMPSSEGRGPVNLLRRGHAARRVAHLLAREVDRPRTGRRQPVGCGGEV